MIEKTNKTHIVSFSGGRTSAYMVWLFEQERKRFPDMKVEYIFNDTGAEHPKTYEFVRNVVEYFNIDLTCLRANVSTEVGVGTNYRVIPLSECCPDLQPFKDICVKYSTPSFAFSHCTREMKQTPARKYCKEKHGKDGYLTWLGIRSDEPKRLQIVDKQVDAFAEKKKVDRSKANIRYLASISDFDKQDVLDFWSMMPFDLQIEEHLGNCVFCIAKGNNKIALAARDEPYMAVDFIRMIDSPSIVKRKNAPVEKDIMYRGKSSLTSIIKTYKDFSREDITDTIRGMKSDASGSCSESCDAINDLFN
jgi:3'-phosphoadenosine 5'-phosphosulfate sulfotransferase (PAPS reductase)/FAD synthetase